MKIDSPRLVSDASTRQSSSWDIKNAPRNYAWLIAFQIGSAIFSFAAVWLITRNFGSEGYGGIVAVIAASQVAQVLVNWTCVVVVRFGVDEFIETEKISRTFWVRLIILLINLILVLSLAEFWFPPLADWLKLSPDAFWLVVVHFGVTALWLHVQMSLQGAKMPRVPGFLQMVERLLIFASFLILIATGKFDFLWVIVCYIAAPAAMIVIGLIQIRGYIFSRFSVDRLFLKKILAYSIPLLPFTLVGYFSGSYVDAIFISNFLSTRDLGVYSVATQINGIAMQLPTLANMLLIPLFISLEKENQTHRTQRFFNSVLPAVVLIGGFLLTVAAFASFFVIPIVFGSEFSASVFPLWILLTASCIGLPVFIGYSAITHAHSVTYIAAITAVLSAISNVVANYLLIPRFGTEGCAWATVIACFVSMATFAILLHRQVEVPVAWVFLAIIPNLIGTILFSLSGNVWISLVASALLTIFILFVKRDALNSTAQILKDIEIFRIIKNL